MRIWAEIYAVDDTHLGDIFSLKEAAVTEGLDGAGTVSFSTPLADKEAFDLLVNERLVRLHIEHDETVRELGRGSIRTLRVQNMETLQTSGPDDLNELTRYSVLLGRRYENETMQTIANDLIGLVPGWTVTVATSYATLLQSCRFDGVNVLKALIRLAEERGLHLRQGTTAGTLEIGPFGTDNNIHAIAPETISHDLYLNDDVILISSINQVTESRELVNWIVPLGAGNGTAAQTLRESTRSVSGGYPYDIQTLTGPDGRTLYYLSDSSSIATYGQSQKVVTFKEIGPVANSTSAKTLAANALYDAAAAWLQKNSLPLVTYKLSAKKVRQRIRVGDKIRVTFKGYIETEQGDVVPINLSNDQFWVMKKTERVSSSGANLDLQISSVDRYEMDTARVVVGALEAINVKNVAVEMFPCYYQDSSERHVQGTAEGSTLGYKDGEWTLQFPDLITDITSVKFQFITRPASANTDEYFGTIGTPPYRKYYYVFDSTYLTPLYPSVLRLFVNDVDVTDDLGGPWNGAGENAALNVTVDISPYILEAAGGIFQTHKIRIHCGEYASNVDHRVSTAYAIWNSLDSVGIIEGKTMVLGSAQAIIGE